MYSDCEVEWYVDIQSEGYHEESLADASAHKQRMNLGDAESHYRVQYQSLATVDQYAPAFEELPYYGYYGLRSEIGRPANAQGRNGWKTVDTKADYYYNNFTNETAKAATNLWIPKVDGWDRDESIDFYDEFYYKYAYVEIWAFRLIDKQPVITYPDGTVASYFYTIKFDHDTDSFHEEGRPIGIMA